VGAKETRRVLLTGSFRAGDLCGRVKLPGLPHKPSAETFITRLLQASISGWRLFHLSIPREFANPVWLSKLLSAAGKSQLKTAIRRFGISKIRVLHSGFKQLV